MGADPWREDPADRPGGHDPYADLCERELGHSRETDVYDEYETSHAPGERIEPPREHLEQEEKSCRREPDVGEILIPVGGDGIVDDPKISDAAGDDDGMDDTRAGSL